MQHHQHPVQSSPLIEFLFDIVFLLDVKMIETSRLSTVYLYLSREPKITLNFSIAHHFFGRTT